MKRKRTATGRIMGSSFFFSGAFPKSVLFNVDEVTALSGGGMNVMLVLSDVVVSGEIMDIMLVVSGGGVGVVTVVSGGGVVVVCGRVAGAVELSVTDGKEGQLLAPQNLISAMYTRLELLGAWNCIPSNVLLQRGSPHGMCTVTRESQEVFMRVLVAIT